MKRPLFWHQGLFLQPQHFQLEDRYFQSSLTPFHQFLQPHFWGVRKMEIQQAALSNFSFNLLSGEFLFQDTTYVCCPGNGLVDARSFEAAWVDGGKPFDVFLGIKNFTDTGENVTVLPTLDNVSDATTRFVSASKAEEVPDMYTGGSSAQVKSLYYGLKIFWETEIHQLGDYSLIPLARLERSGDEITVSEKYIPPVVTLSGSNPLVKILTEIRDQIASRSNQLEAYKREKGIQSAEFGAKDMVFLFALRSLNRYVPLLFHLLESKQVHPWTVYGTLRQLVGELSTFSGQVNVMGNIEGEAQILSDYDHRNLWQCFSGVLSLVTRILDEITSGPEYVIPLVFDGTYHCADLTPAIFEGRNRFFMVFETDEDPSKVLQSLETSAKFGSRETLPILIARALPGLPLEHLTAPPQELPRKAHAIYFQIDHHSDQWVQLQKSNNIALYWDDAPSDLTAELMVVGRS